MHSGEYDGRKRLRNGGIRDPSGALWTSEQTRADAKYDYFSRSFLPFIFVEIDFTFAGARALDDA
jgi:hypothetical protein